MLLKPEESPLEFVSKSDLGALPQEPILRVCGLQSIPPDCLRGAHCTPTPSERSPCGRVKGIGLEAEDLGLNPDFIPPALVLCLFPVQASVSSFQQHLTRLSQNHMMLQCQDFLNKYSLALLIPCFLLQSFLFPTILQSPLAVYSSQEMELL